MSRGMTSIEQTMDWCKHYRSQVHATCEAGVTFESVKDRTVKPFKLPCFKSDGLCNCDKAEFYTVEEAEVIEARFQKMIARTIGAREAILAETKGKRGIQGSIPCPACDGGTLRYSVASLNGHIHASCSTKGCVSWME